MLTQKENTPIVITPMKRSCLSIKVVGVTPLIVNEFGQKQVSAIEKGQKDGPKTKKREARDPQAEYENSKYMLPDGREGAPCSAFKAAMVRACKQLGITMTDAKIAFRVNGERVPIEGESHMRTDRVRVGINQTDLRYRACYDEWSCILSITYNTEVLSTEMIVNLLDRAGSVGICEWRPSAPSNNSGSFGCFEVDPTFEIKDTPLS